MKYELSTLGPDGFERLIQSLLGGETYGDGPDGQREVVIPKATRLPALPGLEVSGRLVAQVKFKSPEGSQSDRDFVLENLKKELDGFRRKDGENRAKAARGETENLYPMPDTWLFVTNVVLTPVLHSGIKDRADALARTEAGSLIPTMYILGADDVQTMLHNRPMVAAAFPALYTEGLRSRRLLRDYAAQCFRSQAAVRLEQAGNATEGRVNLRNVYTDLSVRRRSGRDRYTESFAQWMVQQGDEISDPEGRLRRHRRDLKRRYEMGMLSQAEFDDVMTAANRESAFVLLGEAGQGKSTVCQLLCQIHRAALLRAGTKPPAEALAYEADLPVPKTARIPVPVVLRDYAAWLDRRTETEGALRLYLLHQINDRTGGDLTGPELEELLAQESWLFCFDGLDEVPAASNRARIMASVAAFLGYCSGVGCDCLTVLTSRPQGYESFSEVRLFTPMTLLPMEPERCMAYLGRLLPYLEAEPEEQRRKLARMEAALEDPMTAKLMQTPLYATILLLLARTGGDLPTRRYDLFREYCETITRRERQKGLLAQVDGGYGWVLQLHRQIGLLLQRESNAAANAAAELTLDRLRTLVEGELDPEEDPADRAAETERILESMTRRLPFLASTTTAQGEACVVFPLRSIQEYYAAEGLMAQDNENRIAANLEGISRSAYWRNVYLFVAGCYTADYKRYRNLNESLYTICLRNNGDEAFQEDPDLGALCAVALPGSRLALDLLVEGVFHRTVDKRRYCDLLLPLLETRTQTDLWLEPFRKLEDGLKGLTVSRVLDPLLRRTGDVGCLGAALLWDYANRGLAEAGTLLDELLPTLRLDSPKVCNRLLSLGWDGVSDEALAWLFRAITGPLFGDFAAPGSDGNYLLFLEACCRRFGWSELPLPALRQALYLLWTGSPTLWTDGGGLTFTDSLLGRTWEENINRTFFAISKSSHQALWCRPLLAEGRGEDWEDRGYTDLLTARGLPELAALLDFQRLPAASGLGAIAAAWETLPPWAREPYGRLLACGSWVLERLAAAMEAGEGPEALLPRGDLSWAALVEEDARLRRALEEEDLAVIFSPKGWDPRIRAFSYSNGFSLPLDRLLAVGEREDLPVPFLRLLRADIQAKETLPPKAADFLRRRGRALDGPTAGDYLLLRLFRASDWKDLLGQSFPYPRTLKNSFAGSSRLSLGETEEILTKLSFLTRKLGQQWEAWSLFPVLLPHIRIRRDLPAPVTGEELDRIRATGNPAARFGGLLSRLTGPLTPAEGEALLPELTDLLQGGLARYFTRACNLFSAAGAALLFRAARTRDDPDAQALAQSCAEAIYRDLEAAPPTFQEGA